MAEEGKITMSEFKTVVEEFRTDLKKVVEVMNYRFDKLEDRMTWQEKRSDIMMDKIVLLQKGQDELRKNYSELRVGQDELRAGQDEMRAELKSELKNRVTYKDFKRLEKRVVRLEKKIA